MRTGIRLLALLSMLFLSSCFFYSPAYTGSNPGNQGYQQVQTGRAPEYVPGQNPLRDLEMAVLEYTNQERRNHGLSPLAWEGRLADIARAHSQDMLNRNYFSHTTPEGRGNFEIMEQVFSGRWRSMGENIITSTGRPLNDVQSMARYLVTQWMNSPGHRENILTPEFTHLGVGMAMDMGPLELMGTQCFIRLE